MVGRDFLDELVLSHSLGRMVDGEALSFKRLDGILADVFEKEKSKSFIVYRMEYFWLSDARGSSKGVLAHAFVDRGGEGGGGQGDSSGRWRDGAGDGDGLGHDGLNESCEESERSGTMRGFI